MKNPNKIPFQYRMNAKDDQLVSNPRVRILSVQDAQNNSELFTNQSR